jgi:Protein of unknown function, DUF481
MVAPRAETAFHPMNSRIRLLIGVLIASLVGAGIQPARADTVVLNDGSVIHGRNLHIANGTILISTAFAGDLTIKQDQVAAFETDEPVFVKTKNNSAVLGKVERKDSGLVVSSPGSTYLTQVADVKSSWPEGAEDPDLLALRHHWKIELTTDIAGKSGNSDGFAGVVGAVATMKTPTDALKIYGSANRAVANGTTSEDAYKGGIEYNAFFSQVWSWYLSTELMQDNVKDISLRVSTLGGIGINAIRSHKEDLQFRAGLSYRYETYNTVPTSPDFSSAGFSLGLVHRLNVAPWAVMNNSLNYEPSFQDTNNFILDHDSNLTMPLGGSKFWSLRIGLTNDYTSKPVDSTKRLDSLYYLRFVYDVR